MTNEERILIAKLNTGELDGVVGDLLRISEALPSGHQ